MMRAGMWMAVVLGVSVITAQQANIASEATQSPTDTRGQAREVDAFDAVSIREAQGRSPSSGLRPHPSGLTATNVTVLDLIRLAFDVIEAHVVGELPGWITTKKFDVVAKSSGEPLTYSRLRLMARAMLQERFRLDASYERMEASVYALVMARSDGKAGPNLRPSTGTCAADRLVTEPSALPVRVLEIPNCDVSAFTDSGGLNAVVGNRVTMQKLARALSRYGRFDRPVVDQTGLSGEFDIKALVSADIPGATSDARFLTAMREQLGLTFRSGLGTIDVLRVRRIEQPSPN